MIDPRLDGQVVLVTGGAGGIGAAISEAFAAQGARVAVHHLGGDPAVPAGVRWEHRTPAAGSARRFARDLPGAAIAVEADLADDAAITRLLDEVEARLGPVDVLVNNAAHCEDPDGIDAVTGDGLQRHYRVNAIAPALLTGELARRRRGAGARVINISTDAARAFPGQIGYGTSKAAVEALTRATALDLAGADIRVNAIAPGPVQTGWLTGELLDHATSVVPLGRVGDPEDIADAAVFLASHQARWITGQVLQVAGGHAL
ncbi:SDR family oxidoreductase [Saccharopolyspora cebuensis]|uniref:SDR family NAD(P)-dependent oxidoreductase n=1 Tax=Saccharopolyspora cebuensis TaxID=418759 RepID=A0ABV4CJ22_9PSEU